MSTHTITICDHCREEITHINYGSVEAKPSFCSVAKLVYNQVQYDLCWGCFKELIQWLNPDKVIEETEDE